MDEVAVIKTNVGEMVVGFWPDVAPKTVENFKTLAKKGFYDGTCFHRIVKGFMIQGGDPLTEAIPPWKIVGAPVIRGLQGEGGVQRIKRNVRGVLSDGALAKSRPAGSQFFVCLGDARFLDRQYTAFGQLVKGDDVLGKIGDTDVGQSNSGERSKPMTRVSVESVKIVPADSVK